MAESINCSPFSNLVLLANTTGPASTNMLLVKALPACMCARMRLFPAGTLAPGRTACMHMAAAQHVPERCRLRMLCWDCPVVALPEACLGRARCMHVLLGWSRVT
jgi:hypothetical protein